MTAMYPSPEETDNMRSNRRKACDLCFIKKIKCDMLKPVCSNCSLYNSECRTSIIRRKPNPAKQRQLARTEEENSRVEGLEDRLARIEGQLQKVLEMAKDTRSAPPTRISPNLGSFPVDSEVLQVEHTIGDADYNNLHMDDSVANQWTFDPIEPCLFDGPEQGGYNLPPIEEILPVVDHYFVVYNSVVPLFHQPTFMKMLNGWYNNRQRNRATWAAVQIVMALSYRTPRIGVAESAPLQIAKANECLRNAQAVVSELVTREEDLLGVQIMLGIVMLFQNSRDPKPASVIVGTALRLAHRLQLHSSLSAKYFTQEDAEQRSRVFWIAYTLDKDISMRVRAPSAQLDDDIDIPLPKMIADDGAGMIWTQDGQNHFNYHRMRVELAHIQGRVYDLLYSNRSSKISEAERKQRVDRLQAQLDQWYSRIPSVFRIEHVAAAVGAGKLIQMCKMHHAYLLSEVMVHGIYSSDADWVSRVSTFSRAAMEEISFEFVPHSESCIREQHGPLPDGWNKCVEISRGCMKLFQEAVPTECLIWQCCCAHFSALIVLLANMALNPTHPQVSVDQHLVSKALRLYDKLLEVVDMEALKSLRLVIRELHTKAMAAVAAQKGKDGASNGVFGGLNPSMDSSDSADRLEFLPLGEDLNIMSGPFVSTDLPEGAMATPSTFDQFSSIPATGNGETGDQFSFMG